MESPYIIGQISHNVRKSNQYFAAQRRCKKYKPEKKVKNLLDLSGGVGFSSLI